jgi:hypothetical protein
MNNKYVTEYAQGIAERKYKLSEGLFNAEYIMKQYQWDIWKRLEEIGVVHPPDNKEHYRLSDIEWDNYDNSIELIDCEEGFTLTAEQDRIIREEMGFGIIFVNYKAGPHLYGNHTAAMDAMPVIREEV